MTELDRYNAQQEYDVYQTIMMADECSKEDYLFCTKYDPESKSAWFYDTFMDVYLNMSKMALDQMQHDEQQLRMEIG